MIDVIKCMVVDDEPIGREIVEGYVKETPFLELSASCEDAFDALEILQGATVDLLFSDINMPKINGLEMVRSLPAPPVIIFVTAHDNFALNSYELNVADYLLKPVSYNRFLMGVNKAKVQIDARNANAFPLNEKKIDYIFIKADNKLNKVFFSDIVYIEAWRDYLRVHVRTGKELITYSTMKSMEERLPPEKFFRIHNSYILNIDAMKALMGNALETVTGGSLPIAKNRKEDLLAFLKIDQEK